MSVDIYGQTFKRARLEAAKRRAMPELEDRDIAAKSIGIAADTLRKMENGDRRPSFEILEAMAKAYGCMVGDLFPSSSPRGAEADRILGPLMTLPPMARDLLISDLGTQARHLASLMAMSEEGLFRAVHEPEPEKPNGEPNGSDKTDRPVMPLT